AQSLLADGCDAGIWSRGTRSIQSGRDVAFARAERGHSIADEVEKRRAAANVRLENKELSPVGRSSGSCSWASTHSIHSRCPDHDSVRPAVQLQLRGPFHAPYATQLRGGDGDELRPPRV